VARWIFGALVVAAAAACSDGKAPEPGTHSEATEVSGGSTEDFNGNPVPCTNVVHVPVDEADGTVRFSDAVQQMRGLVEGDYSIPIVWVHPRRDSECDTSDGGGVIGTETVVRVGIHATGEAATVLDSGDNDVVDRSENPRRCAEVLRIPAIVTIRSDDGALDEEFAADIRTDDTNGAELDFGPDELATSDLQGTLAIQAPSGSTIQIQMVASDLIYLAIYVNDEPDCRWLESSTSGADDSGGIPRNSVLD
jgi:hypothetical protein